MHSHTTRRRIKILTLPLKMQHTFFLYEAARASFGHCDKRKGI